MHYYFNYRTLAFLFPSPFFLLWFLIYQSTQNIHSITNNSTSYKSPSKAGQVKAAGVGTVVCIPTRERAMGNKTQPSSCLAAFILPFDCWVTFTNHILQCRICAVEEVGWEWKPKQTIWGSGGHVLKGAISQGLVNWWRVKDSPYYSRKGVHSAGTLRAFKDPK